jgi:hypothetical protein
MASTCFASWAKDDPPLSDLSPRTLRAIALPAEHGGWSFVAEPAILGLAVAPSEPGGLIAGAALAGFLARQPLKLVLTDRRRGVRYPRTGTAALVFVAFALVAALLLAAAFRAAAWSRFWVPLAAAAPVGLVAVVFDARGRSREAAAEAAAAVALGASASAIALAGAASTSVAWGAWALVALRAVTSVLYVRARLRLDRGHAVVTGAVHLGHAAAFGVACVLAAAGVGPWLGAVAFLVLLARSGWGLSARRGAVRPQALGWQEVGYGALTVALLAVGYRAGR